MKSIKAPIVILPKYLQGSGADLTLAAESYFVIELEKWLTSYKAKLVKRRVRYIEKQTKLTA